MFSSPRLHLEHKLWVVGLSICSRRRGRRGRIILLEQESYNEEREERKEREEREERGLRPTSFEASRGSLICCTRFQCRVMCMLPPPVSCSGRREKLSQEHKEDGSTSRNSRAQAFKALHCVRGTLDHWREAHHAQFGA